MSGAGSEITALSEIPKTRWSILVFVSYLITIRGMLGNIPGSLRKIGREEIKPFLDYAVKTYGSNFTDLYDK